MVWILALAARGVLDLWLQRWVSQVNVPMEWRNRRRQRHRSLQRVPRRPVRLSCLPLAVLWIVVDLPGVRQLSDLVVLAGGCQRRCVAKGRKNGVAS